MSVDQSEFLQLRSRMLKRSHAQIYRVNVLLFPLLVSLAWFLTFLD